MVGDPAPSPTVIAQLSDPHVGAPEGPAERWIHTSEHLLRAIDRINRWTPRVDAVVISGDLVDRGQPDEVDRLKSILSSLRVPYLLLPGNHDDRGLLMGAFGDRFGPRSGSKFLHQVVAVGPLSLVLLDTVVPGAPHGELCSERLEWFEEQLYEHRGRPTLVFMHHPPFRSGLALMDEMMLRDAERFEEVVKRFPNIERVVCGHLHRPVSCRFGGTVAMSCPSTAHQMVLDLGVGRGLRVSMEPPGFLLHVWDGVSLVSHVQPVAEPAAWVLHDGDGWLSRPPPDGFQPAPQR